MGREDLPWIGVIVLLLLIGLLLGRQYLDASQGARATELSAQEEESFRHWLWEARSLDLVVQAGLIFGGALGIAALLPRREEGE